MSIEGKNPKIVVVVGPTASGKSDLAVKIAKKIGGEIISADSRQIYKGMDIGSGKITKGKMGGIPHYLIDVADPKKDFSVARYQTLAKKAFRDILNRKKIPIVCGGTGLYIRALVDGLVIPKIKPNLKLRKRLEKIRTEELFEILKNLDPERAKNIDPKNPRRLIRALEIVESAGKVPKLKLEPISENILLIGIKKNEEILKKLIHGRLLKRIKGGLINEVRLLHRSGLSYKRLESFGLEYRSVAELLQSKVGKKEMIAKLEKNIYQYSKRQMTWFKKDKRIRWIKSAKEISYLLREFLKK